jgi:hypothetical protein
LLSRDLAQMDAQELRDLTATPITQLTERTRRFDASVGKGQPKSELILSEAEDAELSSNKVDFMTA